VEKALSELARIVPPGGSLALFITNQAASDHKIERRARRVFGRQVRTHRLLRRLLLHLNNLLCRLRFAPTHAATTLLVFEKRR